MSEYLSIVGQCRASLISDGTWNCYSLSAPLLVNFLLNECDHVLRNIQHAIEIFLRGVKRWLEFKDVRGEAAELSEKAIVQRKVPGFPARGSGRNFGLEIL